MICSLDIGTATIKVIVAERDKEGNLNVISKAEREGEGIRRGVVIEPEKISNILVDIFQKLSQEVGKKIDSVYLSINGSHLFSLISRGLVSVSRADQKISEEDVQRVVQAAEAINLSSNREIFDVMVKEFIIDGQTRVKQAIGLEGVRLEAEVLAIGGFSPYLENHRRAVLGADLTILDLQPAPLMAAKAVLSEKQKELGTAVVDIGAGTTGLAVFEEGELIHLAVLPIGSANITNDIAIGLKVDVEIAERIKREYGTCFFPGKDSRLKIEVNGSSLVFSRKFLAKIISERVSELFNQLNQELKKIGKEKLLPGGIVLTGGGAQLPHLVELAKDKFRLPARIGKIKKEELKEDLRFTVAWGLILHAAELEEEKKGRQFKVGLISKVKNFFKMFLP